MGHTATWVRFGPAVTAHPGRTLAAYLGHQGSIAAFRSGSVTFPTPADFMADPDFDPNPHNLDLPEDSLATTLLVQSLAIWGPDAIMRTALACARVQVQHQPECRQDLVTPRDDALRAVEALMDSPPKERNYAAVRRAADLCTSLYSPYEEEPDAPDGEVICHQLGAPWFAAETAAQEFEIQPYDGPGPREGCPTWCRRNTVWTDRAADVAAHWASHSTVREQIRRALVEWAMSGQE